MKIISTQKYQRVVNAQQMYDPDNPDEPMDVYDTEVFDIEAPEDGAGELETITPDDVLTMIEDDQEDEGEQDEAVEPKIEPEGYPQFSTVFQAAQWAKNNKEVMRIEYRCESGRTITRDIEAHGDFYAKTTHRRIVVSYDETVGDIRAFILKNITSYQFIGEKFTPKFNFSQTRRNYKRKLRHRALRRQRI